MGWADLSALDHVLDERAAGVEIDPALRLAVEPAWSSPASMVPCAGYSVL